LNKSDLIEALVLLQGVVEREFGQHRVQSLRQLDVLEQVLASDWDDFGQDIFARLIEAGHPVYAFDFSTKNAIQEYQYITRGGQRLKVLSSRASDSDYWRDVGTIQAYWLASLDVVSTSPRFNLYGERWPIFNYPQFFPPAKFVHRRPAASAARSTPSSPTASSSAAAPCATRCSGPACTCTASR